MDPAEFFRRNADAHRDALVKLGHPAPAPAFDEARFEARVSELIAEGWDRGMAEDTAWLEQQPGGDAIVEP